MLKSNLTPHDVSLLSHCTLNETDLNFSTTEIHTGWKQFLRCVQEAPWWVSLRLLLCVLLCFCLAHLMASFLTQIKVKTFCCGWTAWHVYGWVSIIWLSISGKAQFQARKNTFSLNCFTKYMDVLIILHTFNEIWTKSRRWLTEVTFLILWQISLSKRCHFYECLWKF